jgi:hypothetical protein
LVSTTSVILIGVGVVALGIAGYFTYNLLMEDSPSGALARARLGLDTRPGAGILQDPKLANYKSNPQAPGYQNTSKSLIENPEFPQSYKDALKLYEKFRAERYFGKANAGFMSYAGLADEQERPEPWASHSA